MGIERFELSRLSATEPKSVAAADYAIFPNYLIIPLLFIYVLVGVFGISNKLHISFLLFYLPLNTSFKNI